MRQIRMLRAMRRELETGLRRLLHGHAGGNPGHSQGAAYGLPRQFPTLPGCEVGDEALGQRVLVEPVVEQAHIGALAGGPRATTRPKAFGNRGTRANSSTREVR